MKFRNITDPPAPVELTPIEKSVLLLMWEEMPAKQMAPILNRSERTIEGIKQNLLKKANASNNIGVIKFGIKHGIITP